MKVYDRFWELQRDCTEFIAEQNRHRLREDIHALSRHIGPVAVDSLGLHMPWAGHGGRSMEPSDGVRLPRSERPQLHLHLTCSHRSIAASATERLSDSVSFSMNNDDMTHIAMAPQHGRFTILRFTFRKEVSPLLRLLVF